ncbi:MAG: hypothetical protein ISR65_06705 [Bacteriovoracaceae bacterium]|nr:hypothetical protein [Bacteriovoracaceae bacterium]
MRKKTKLRKMIEVKKIKEDRISKSESDKELKKKLGGGRRPKYFRTEDDAQVEVEKKQSEKKEQVEQTDQKE